MRYCFFLALLLIFLLSGCADPNPTLGPEQPAPPVLRDVFEEDFLIGATLGKKQLRGGDDRALEIVAREFSAISPENDLKWSNIHPARDTFNWGPADTYVAFGEQHDLWTLGHALVWYLQVADYVGEVEDPTEMRAVLKEHIAAVAGRYAGRIDAWDVLNEAVEDDGTMRSWPVYDVLGEDYVAEVFKMARTAAPDAELYYNDYNMWMKPKRDGIIRMLKAAIAAGAPIDGVGLQSHYGIDSPSLDTIEAAIEDFKALGLKVMITELDLTVLPNPWDNPTADPRVKFENTPYMNPYPEGLPDSMQTKLAERYTDLFRLYRKHADAIDRVTFWGIYDGSTWLNNWPVKGRTNYPLLWDRNYEPKAAYDSLMLMRE